jgi:hemolysin type calcium-binding protein
MMMLVAGAALALLVASGVALAASINCPNAPNGFCYGTNVGDGMYGDFRVDKMYGFGGADLMEADGNGDRMYGGNEFGWGDKLLGQRGEDWMEGNRGNDALYTGMGDDQVNARDGQRDVITCGPGSDLIYLAFRLDVLRDCGTNRAETSRLAPPDDLFAHTGKVFVNHDGSERCLPEEELKDHLEHGDEILNPAGCSNDKQGR